jgi:thiamine monophosphate kinase
LSKAIQAVRAHGTELTVIGVVTKKGVLLETDGRASRLENKGWEHFRPRKK